MNKFKGVFLAVLVFFMSLNCVNAACDTAEENRLRSLAVKVQMSYEEAFEELPEDSYFPPEGLSPEEEEEYVGYRTLFHVYITNLTEDLYVEVKDKNSGKTTTYHYSDSDNGTITLTQEIYYMNTYTLTVYAENQDCGGKRLATSSLKTPKYNEYSEYELCVQNSEYYMCNRYVDYELPGFSEFVKKISKYASDKEKKKEEEKNDKNKSFADFLKENKVTIGVTVVIVIGIGVGTTVVIIRKRRRVV